MADAEDYVRDLTPDAHASSHESGGSDELDITGLTPPDHASRHENGGGDEIDASGLTGVGTVLVDRGDNAAADLGHATMTIDSAWHDWDMSSVVPAGAIAVELTCQAVHGTVGKVLSFRKNGNTNDKNVLEYKILVGGATHQWAGMVFCDANRVIEYYAVAGNGGFSNIEINIRGWWI